MILKDITSIKKTGICLIFFFVLLMSFFVLPINNASAGLECTVGFDDCDCDGTCEMPVLSDPLNCGKCGNVCPGNYCNNGSCSPVTGGLVPCGRMYDNPDSIWNEQEPCKICHAVPLIDSVIDYLVGIIGLITVLFIIIGGLMSVTSMGGSGALSLAKTAISKSLLGFVFVLIAWVIINVGMVVFGFDDPLGDGSWAKFNCDLITTPMNQYCGDGLIHSPNSDGINEVCDPQELKNDFITRTGLTGEDWVEEIYACDPITCNFGCATDITVSADPTATPPVLFDPGFSEIGEGCYQPNLAGGGTGTACQKGRYICDFNTDTVICQNTFNDISYRLAGDFCGDVYDYCCDSNITDLLALDFYIKRTTTPINTPFRCDDICKNFGKICIGVGLMDAVNYSCLSIIDNNTPKTTCDDGINTYNCNNLTNIAGNDCRSNFNIRMVTDCVECYDSDLDGNTEGFYFGVWETACYCL